MPSTTRRRSLILATLCAGTFMGMLDNVVVANALPRMSRDLGIGISGLQWAVEGYSLVFAALLIPGGAVGDRFGRRRIYLGGLLLFTAGSALTASATGVSTLVLGRAVQAVGAAGLVPQALPILRAVFPERREQARAFAQWSAVSALGLALGPLIGGPLVGAFGWPSAFWINIPIGLAAGLLGLRVLPADTGAYAHAANAHAANAHVATGTTGIASTAAATGTIATGTTAATSTGTNAAAATTITAAAKAATGTAATGNAITTTAAAVPTTVAAIGNAVATTAAAEGTAAASVDAIDATVAAVPATGAAARAAASTTGTAIAATGRRAMSGRAPIGLVAQVSLAVGLGLFVFVLIEAPNRGWTSPAVLAAASAGVLALAVLWFAAARGRAPIGLAVLRDRTARTAVIAGAAISFAMFGLMTFLGLFLQTMLGWSPAGAGIVSLPSTLCVILVSPLAGRLTVTRGPRLPLAAGLMSLATALLFLSLFGTGARYAAYGWALPLMGVGLGLSYTPVAIVVMRAAPEGGAGGASAIVSASREIGGTAGIAVMGTILTSRFRARLASGLAALHLPGATTHQILAGTSVGGSGGLAVVNSSALGGPVRAAIAQSFVAGLHLALWGASAVLILAATLVWMFVPAKDAPGDPDPTVPTPTPTSTPTDDATSPADSADVNADADAREPAPAPARDSAMSNL